jgi:hypothetical protein
VHTIIIRFLTTAWFVLLCVVSCLIGLTVDNGANYKKAGWFFLGDKNDVIPCFLHTLQLSVHECLVGEVKADIDCIRSCIVWICSSSTLLKIMQNGGNTLELIHDCDTRWDSSCDMIERALKLKTNVMQCFVSNRPKCPVVLSEDLFNRLKAYLTVLTGVREVTKKMQLRGHLSLGMVVPFLLSLRDFLAPNFDGGVFLENFRASLLQCVEHRLGWILLEDNVFLRACALHPLYGHLGFTSASLRNVVWGSLLEDAVVMTTKSCLSDEAKRRNLSGLLQSLRELFESRDYRKRLFNMQKFDVFEEYKLLTTDFSGLFQLIQGYAGIQGSTHEVERMWSGVGINSTFDRPLLSEDHVADLGVVRDFFLSRLKSESALKIAEDLAITMSAQH